MTNNYILRRLRYTFQYNNQKMVDICALGGLAIDNQLVNYWLKKEEDAEYIRCSDHEMAQFLNGFIIEKRGKKDDQIPKAEYSLNNNIIFRKLKIALNFIDQDILDTLKTADFNLGKAELSAFFRKPDHKHYRECQDQVLRNFLQGLQMQLTNASSAKPQSDYQKLKSTSENRKAANKQNKGKTDKPFLNKKKESNKVVYKNPNKQRAKLTLKKDEAEPAVNQDIWGKGPRT